MLLYFVVVFRARLKGPPELSKLLWAIYTALGVSAMFIAATDVLQPVYPPNYDAALFLALCVLIGVASFHRFRASHLAEVLTSVRRQGPIEMLLIGSQFFAIVFFTPFAAMSLVGDARENRLNIADKMDLMGSYGFVNTFAGAASQLFAASLIMAGIRLAQPHREGRNVPRALVLILASLSYVVYILAYVGRDGVVYWLMTSFAVFLLFHRYIPRVLRRRIISLGIGLCAALLAPFLVITIARFIESEHGSAWSILDYFGSQIQNFGDYSSIERPLTFGVANFPMFISAACRATGLTCQNWGDIKEFIFDLYLAQDKEPWLFGTYVSDFVGDFGFPGAFAFLSGFGAVCHFVSSRPRPLTLSRLLLVVFLFLVPYWGVFFFRFSIINGFIVVNLGFIFLVHLWHRTRASSSARSASRSRCGHPQHRASIDLDLAN